MFRSFLAFLLLVEFACPVFAAPPDPKTLAVPPVELSKSRELVQKLGSEEFDEREEAERALAKMGRLARVALLEGVNADPNPEVRTRCEALIPRANSLEMKARLEVFLADTESKYEHDLPGWNQFRATVCNDWNLFGYTISCDQPLAKSARSVFVELISTPANKSVVMAAGASRAELTSIGIGRRQELYNQRLMRPNRGGFVTEPAVRHDPTAEDVASLLFVESLATQSTARVPRMVSISALLNSSGFYSQVREADDKGKVYKAIATAWLESRINPMDLYQGMTIAPSLGLSDQSIKIAVRLLTAPGAPVAYRGNAASTLVRNAGKEHIPLLEKAFQDTSVLTVARPTIRINVDNDSANDEIQVRDVALAISIQLAGEKLEDFGFIDQLKANNPGTVIGGNGGVYSYTRFYIPAEKRDAALEKWKEWWAKNREK
jgi:hypothetical protein